MNAIVKNGKIFKNKSQKIIKRILLIYFLVKILVIWLANIDIITIIPVIHQEIVLIPFRNDHNFPLPPYLKKKCGDRFINWTKFVYSWRASVAF